MKHLLFAPAAIGCFLAMTAPAGVVAQYLSPEVETQMKLHSCPEYPAGPVTEADVAGLIPDNMPGHVMVKWKLESQENTYGFNIYRSTTGPNGKYIKVNPWMIPGDGTTNVPKVYCFNDTPTTRGMTLHYYIEEVTMDGTSAIVEGTMGTKVTVKSIANERAWLLRKINGAAGNAVTTGTATSAADKTTTAANGVSSATK